MNERKIASLIAAQRQEIDQLTAKLERAFAKRGELFLAARNLPEPLTFKQLAELAGITDARVSKAIDAAQKRRGNGDR